MPGVRFEMTRGDPVPSVPLIDEVHVKLAATGAPLGPSAVPWKVIVVSGATCETFVGEAIVTWSEGTGFEAAVAAGEVVDGEVVDGETPRNPPEPWPEQAPRKRIPSRSVRRAPRMTTLRGGCVRLPYPRPRTFSRKD
jgi:hypothetical protein